MTEGRRGGRTERDNTLCPGDFMAGAKNNVYTENNKTYEVQTNQELYNSIVFGITLNNETFILC
jgi:hypothetical protein